ncbi:hypothetical protein JTE90_018931 [Oedothorax gibbosus]|uniref:Protein LMBR1L n=1 Tax=Oedothorax gibbosus TaxID=931172 RepID=A0AAV6VWN4_9ARAC|nr:hypothetical protein JTE90_018931 [Oedothorax gibbosus]
MENEDDPEDWKIFYNKIREYVVFLLIFLTLYFISYCLIFLFKKHMKTNGLFSGTYEDAVAYRIALWICTFSLGISIGSALLLPISIVSNEVLLVYPNHYYVQWLNSSLIQGLWSLVFLFSNLALFIMLPFAHLFIESEGLPGSSKGVMGRVYEAAIVLLLLGLILMGLTYIISAVFDDGHYSITSVFNVSNYYLPFLYSCVSFIGVLMLLICTPVGFGRLFTVTGTLLVKLKTQPRQNDDMEQVSTENGTMNESFHTRMAPKAGELYRRKVIQDIPFEEYREDGRRSVIGYFRTKESGLRYAAFKRNCVYPLMMLFPLVLTVWSVLIVIQNSLELCFGIKALPTYSQNISLGITSLSSLGLIGAAIQIILILYLWCTSIVGLYSLPLFRCLRPTLHNTSMTQVIGNCAVLLVLSSALPVLARSLGITNFDLLDDFGRINWLGNFYIVLFHNIVFTVTAIICLVSKITSAARNELYFRLRNLHRYSVFT